MADLDPFQAARLAGLARQAADGNWRTVGYTWKRDALQARDRYILELLAEAIPASQIVAATGLSRARVYQIRTRGHRPKS